MELLSRLTSESCRVIKTRGQTNLEWRSANIFFRVMFKSYCTAYAINYARFRCCATRVGNANHDSIAAGKFNKTNPLQRIRIRDKIFSEKKKKKLVLSFRRTVKLNGR